MRTTDAVKRIAEEHGALRAAAGSIRGLLQGGPCPCGKKVGCRCLAESVDRFHEHLVQHFQEEESAWRRIDSTRADWATLRWIGRLEKEHEQLRASLGEIRLALAAPEPPPDLPSRIEAILHELLEHELSETKLFQRSVLEDVREPP